MKEEKQDPDFIDRDRYKNEIKKEQEDPDFPDQHRYKTVIKEENHDHDLKSETVEEYQKAYFVDQDRYATGMNEDKNKDDDFNESGMTEVNPDHRSNAPAQPSKGESSSGPRGQQPQVTVSKRQGTSWTGRQSVAYRDRQPSTPQLHLWAVCLDRGRKPENPANERL